MARKAKINRNSRAREEHKGQRKRACWRIEREIERGSEGEGKWPRKGKVKRKENSLGGDSQRTRQRAREHTH